MTMICSDSESHNSDPDSDFEVLDYDVCYKHNFGLPDLTRGQAEMSEFALYRPTKKIYRPTKNLNYF